MSNRKKTTKSAIVIIATHPSQKTTCYTAFVRHPQNRFTTAGMIARNQEKLTRSGWDRTMPAVVRLLGNGTYEILDGQHRIEAARRMEIPIWFSVTDDKTLTPAMINATQTGWKIRNFVETYANDGLVEYVKLSAFAEEYKIGISLAASLLAGDNVHSGTATESVKRGTFKIKNLVGAKRVAAMCKTIRPLFAAVAYANSVRVLSAFISVEDFDDEMLVRQCEKNSAMLHPCSKLAHYLEMYDEIYNFRRRNRVALAFLALDARNKKSKK